ncbi:MAG TPA: hypothetical protein VFW40_05285 [Capsulimonadaceae bacterium]|nr:hypothetical protein [Capsulimonadaceae bacterium]
MAEPPRPNEASPPPLAESLPDAESVAPPTPAPRAARPRTQPAIAPPNEEAQKFVRDANLLRMRGQFVPAVQAMQSAIRLAPNDPEAVELLGDIQKQAGRLQDALAAYTRAAELQSAPGRRATIEAKMARIVLERDKAAIGQLQHTSLGQGNVLTTVVLSAVVPGLGQILAGQTWRGAIILATWAITLIIVLLLPQTKIVFDGLFSELRGGPPAPAGDALKVLAVLLVNVAIWIFAMIDAAATARRASGG